eukprot:654437-Lingulodinium_polyedra.AAC.1
MAAANPLPAGRPACRRAGDRGPRRHHQGRWRRTWPTTQARTWSAKPWSRSGSAGAQWPGTLLSQQPGPRQAGEARAWPHWQGSSARNRN